MPGRLTAATLAPITAALRQMFGTDDVPGLAPGLLVTDEFGWDPATRLLDGTRLPELLRAASRQWGGSPHACAALAWKSYSYWAALPVVLGWASARRVPLLDPADTLIHFEDHRALPTMGLRPSTTVAVLPADPLALAGLPEVRVVPGEAELLGALRASLLDAHLAPMISAIQAEVRIGTRTLLGSVASGIAHGILRAADGLPGSSVATIDTLLGALDLRDLVDLVPGPSGEPTVQRRTCCLAFTLPQPKTCQGCCVRHT
ncbi:IucA/IucC family C-terminal-domain containing protein [Micromonospora sp. WMMA1363]|uniref:IucA/IucC family C-terminal-domain containing protein n=1 Tax=Micromonospora sp. WMMA1363 TaxID=3053985 RepID=UPI00259C95DC|nr:IucA/IucC family C-terminal-domain containing protein [Micromonospora sp. WMMA1363]MDM4721825.1 IucA/IucC family C-terminal-domain containing protein [Micromonospora sp. WMMA1363]